MTFQGDDNRQSIFIIDGFEGRKWKHAKLTKNHRRFVFCSSPEFCVMKNCKLEKNGESHKKKVTKHRKIMYHEQIADEIVNDCCAVVCTTAASFTF